MILLAPALPAAVFARAAASLAGLASGSPVLAGRDGWLLPGADLPVLVTPECSGVDFFLLVAALLAWQSGRRINPAWRAVPVAVILAAPIAIFVNALRIVAVVQAHGWVIPQLPASYAPFAHLLTGVAVFLPALVALNLLCEIHGRHLTPSRA